MTATIIGPRFTAASDCPDSSPYDVLSGSIVDSLYEHGTRHFTTLLAPGADLWCMDYLARRRAQGMMRDTHITGVFNDHIVNSEKETEMRQRVLNHMDEMASPHLFRDHEDQMLYIVKQSNLIVSVFPPTPGQPCLARLTLDIRGEVDEARYLIPQDADIPALIQSIFSEMIPFV